MTCYETIIADLGGLSLDLMIIRLSVIALFIHDMTIMRPDKYRKTYRSVTANC